MFLLIKQADFLGTKANLLSMDGTKKSKNFYGGLISLIMTLLIVSSIVYFLYEFFTRKRLNLVSNFVEDSNISISKFQSIPFMLRISGDGNVLMPKNYYVITMKLSYFEEAKASTTYKDMALEACDLSKDFHNKNENYSDLFKSISNLDSYYCPRWKEDFNLTGVYGSEKYTYIRLSVSPCVGHSYCGNHTDVVSALAGSYLDFVTVTSSINHNNENPYEKKLIRKRMSVSNTIFKRVRFYYESINYLTDVGYIFEENHTLNLNSLSNNYDVEVDLRNVVDKEFLSIHNFPLTTNYFRLYMKVQAVLANIGGIINGLSILGMLVTYSVSKNLMDQDLINTIFDSDSTFKLKNDQNEFNITNNTGFALMKKSYLISDGTLENEKEKEENTYKSKQKTRNNRNKSNDYELGKIRLRKSIHETNSVANTISMLNTETKGNNESKSSNRMIKSTTNKLSQINQKDDVQNVNNTNSNVNINNFIKPKTKIIKALQSSQMASESFIQSSALVFSKNNFQFSYLDLLDPIQLCLGKNKKTLYVEKMYNVTQFLKVDNLLSTFQEINLIKKLLFDENQLTLVNNLYKTNPDCSELKRAYFKLLLNKDDSINSKLISNIHV